MTMRPGQSAILILLIWAAGLGAAAQFGKVAVIYDTLVLQYGGTARVAIMVSVVGLIGLIFGTTAGIVVQRLGMRRMLVGALLIGAALSAVQASLPPYPVMMLSRVLEGVSHLAIVVVGPVMIAQIAPLRFQGLAMTLWSSFFGLSFAILAWLGPLIVAAGGVAVFFLGHAGYMVVIAVLLFLLLPERSRGDPVPLSLGGIIRQHGQIYRSPRIAAPAMGFICYTMLYVAILTLLPPLLGDDRVLAATAMPLISISVSLTLGVWLLKQVSAVHMVQAGFAVAMLAALAMGGFWAAPAFRLGAALVMAAALGIVQGASFASIPQLNESAGDRAMAAGAVAQLGNLGTTSGTPVLAALIALYGFGGVVGFAAPLCLAGIVIHGILSWRRSGR